MEAIVEQGRTLLDSISAFCRNKGVAESTFGGRAAPAVPQRTDLGKEARHCNFNSYSDARAVFRYDMHTLPTEIAESIGTSTLFAAWNAAVCVARIDDERLTRVVGERNLDATRDVPQTHGGPWFLDESYVVSRKRG